MFPVVADKTDAWTHAPNQVIGAVFLRSTPEKDPPVLALQVVCPHKGCTIRYVKTDEGGHFVCPCHEAYFDLNGQISVEPSRSPRPMDELEVEIRNQDEILVEFKNFRIGTPPPPIPEA
jgi:Rieske Fe-S protein